MGLEGVAGTCMLLMASRRAAGEACMVPLALALRSLTVPKPSCISLQSSPSCMPWASAAPRRILL